MTRPLNLTTPKSYGGWLDGVPEQDLRDVRDAFEQMIDMYGTYTEVIAYMVQEDNYNYIWDLAKNDAERQLVIHQYWTIISLLQWAIRYPGWNPVCKFLNLDCNKCKRNGAVWNSNNLG